MTNALASAAERARLFRQRAAEMHLKAAKARSDEMRGSWLIVARDWTKMADREEAKASPPKAKQ
jgi:hypothetical protein